MCGVTAVFKYPTVDCSAKALLRMRDSVAHRGPDDEGAVFFKGEISTPIHVRGDESNWNVGLGHRRLSILDLSSTGRQPMLYRNRYWIVYNGEVYNYLELQAELKKAGHDFISRSDTEVVLAAFAEWGTECFRRFRGMWGLVIFDALRNEAVLSRDRLGIKPLYLWSGNGFVAVASEIKQFLVLPGFQARLDRGAGAEFLQSGYEYQDRTFFEGVRPMPAGTWCRVALERLEIESSKPFWFPEKIQPTVTEPVEAGQLFSRKLRESVELHLRSDVLVGSALSGGLDSSAIAVLFNQIHSCDERPLHTFTATFPGDSSDERVYAEAILRKIRAEPHFITPDPQGFLDDLDRFVWAHDEPMGGLSVYSAFCIARLARETGVPVALNGQGGDEVLSGYWQTYFAYLRSLAQRGRMLSLGKHLAGSVLGYGNPELLIQVPVMLRRYRERSRPQPFVRFHNAVPTNGSGALNEFLSLPEQARRVYEIRSMFLPRLLKWDDRNSMAFGIEGRYPFLDHELIEQCLSFVPNTLYCRGWVKWPLRLALKDLLPATILQRKTKLGFEVPQNQWLCGALKTVIDRWFKEDRPVWDLVEKHYVKNLADKMSNKDGQYDEPGQLLLRLFLFDRWLGQFSVVP